ncbi:hypothetical protein [Ornithinimicrobium sp. Y1694]|uniref:hypothetical protein n=1 Tax=Ornithinimicrobium sp. Y1694 TaxID=3418590 RepID=UPI003CF78A35
MPNTKTKTKTTDVAAELRAKRAAAIAGGAEARASVTALTEKVEKANEKATDLRASAMRGETVTASQLVKADAEVELAELVLSGAKRRASGAQSIPQNVGIVETVAEALRAANLGLSVELAESAPADDDSGQVTAWVIPGPGERGTTYRPIDAHAESYQNQRVRVVLTGGAALTIPEDTLTDALEAHPRLHRVAVDVHKAGRDFTVNIGHCYPDPIPTLTEHKSRFDAASIPGSKLSEKFYSPQYGQAWAGLSTEVYRRTTPHSVGRSEDLPSSVEVISQDGEQVRLKLTGQVFVATYPEVSPFGGESYRMARRHVEQAVPNAVGHVLSGLGTIEKAEVTGAADGLLQICYETVYKKA